MKSRVVMGGEREISSMTRSAMVPVTVLVLRRSFFHDEDPGWRWSAVRDACLTRALCLLLREPVTPQVRGW